MKIYDIPIILASGSPRRAEIMKNAGFSFEVQISNADESFDSNLNPPDISMTIANRKAEAVFMHDIDKEAIVIAADTIVVFENEILEKPVDREDAERMIQKLSNNRHLVYTGVCIKGPNKTISFASRSEVEVYPVSKEEISYYIENHKPFDKAGAYGIQEWFGLCKVKKIIGSHFNIMGLPIAEVYEQLTSFIE